MTVDEQQAIAAVPVAIKARVKFGDVLTFLADEFEIRVVAMVGCPKLVQEAIRLRNAFEVCCVGLESVSIGMIEERQAPKPLPNALGRGIGF